MQTKKFLQRMAIMLSIAAFSIAGVVACAGADEITGSVSGGTTGGTKPGVSSSYPNSPMDGSWDNDSYRQIYVPFAGVYYKNAKGENVWNYATVSYMDSNTLTQLWKDQMDAKGRGKDKDFFLRNANTAGNLKAGNDYYFFDSDFNIRHKKYPNVVIKEFVGGVMTAYYHDDPGSESKGTIVVGGLYKTMLNDTRSVGNDKGIGYFLNGRTAGELEVLIFNVGATQGGFTYFGLDITYYKGNSGTYTALKRDAKSWYTVDRKPETLVQVLQYDTLRNKYKADGRTDGSYFYFSEGKAEITR